MLPILISLPILSGLLILQSAIVSRIHLLHGSADLLLLALVAWALQEEVTSSWQWSLIGGLMISIVSAVPAGFLFAGYLLITALALFLKHRIWQVPLLAMLVTTLLGTLVIHILSFAARIMSGAALPLIDSFNLITLPSILLNLLLAVPIFALMGDLASWLYHKEIEV